MNLLYIEIIMCILAGIVICLAFHRGFAEKFDNNQITMIAVAVALLGVAATLYEINWSSVNPKPGNNQSGDVAAPAPKPPLPMRADDKNLVRSELQQRQKQLDIINQQIDGINNDITSTKALINEDEEHIAESKLGDADAIGNAMTSAITEGSIANIRGKYNKDNHLYNSLEAELAAANLSRIKLRNIISELNQKLGR